MTVIENGEMLMPLLYVKDKMELAVMKKAPKVADRRIEATLDGYKEREE